MSAATKTAFIAQLLAQSSSASEPVTTSRMRAEIREASRNRLYVASMKAEIAWYNLRAATVEGIMVRVAKTEPDWTRTERAENEALERFIAAVDAMMCAPAPDKGRLDGKRRDLKRWGFVAMPSRPAAVSLCSAARERWHTLLNEDAATLGVAL